MKSHQPAQPAVPKQEQVQKEDDMENGGTENEKYFSFLLYSWGNYSGESPSLGEKEVQEMMWAKGRGPSRKRKRRRL